MQVHDFRKALKLGFGKVFVLFFIVLLYSSNVSAACAIGDKVDPVTGGTCTTTVINTDIIKETTALTPVPTPTPTKVTTETIAPVCTAPYYLDSASNTCVSTSIITPIISTTTTCVAPTVFDSKTNSCVNSNTITSTTNCIAPMVFNSTTKTCELSATTITTTTTCVAPTVFDSKTNSCVNLNTTTSTINCIAPMVFNSTTKTCELSATTITTTNCATNPTAAECIQLATTFCTQNPNDLKCTSSTAEICTNDPRDPACSNATTTTDATSCAAPMVFNATTKTCELSATTITTATNCATNPTAPECMQLASSFCTQNPTAPACSTTAAQDCAKNPDSPQCLGLVVDFCASNSRDPICANVNESNPPTTAIDPASCIAPMTFNPATNSCEGTPPSTFATNCAKNPNDPVCLPLNSNCVAGVDTTTGVSCDANKTNTVTDCRNNPTAPACQAANTAATSSVCVNNPADPACIIKTTTAVSSVCIDDPQAPSCLKITSAASSPECVTNPADPNCISMIANAASSVCSDNPKDPACRAMTTSPICIEKPNDPSCKASAAIINDSTYCQQNPQAVECVKNTSSSPVINCGLYPTAPVCISQTDRNCAINPKDPICLATIPPPKAAMDVTKGNTISATMIEAKFNTAPTTQSPTNPSGEKVAVQNVMAMVTEKDSEMTVERENGTKVKVKEKSVTVFHPPKASKIQQDPNSSSTQEDNSVSLIRGSLTSSIDCTQPGDYTVRTAIADIVAAGSCNLQAKYRASGVSEFTTDYSQSGVDGSLTVTAISGTVTVTDREGNVTTLNAGEEVTILNKVPRSTWVMPIDGDSIYGGSENLFTWVAYPDAQGYLIEYNIPTPIFSEENTNLTEYEQQTIRLFPADYEVYDDLIIYRITLQTGMEGTTVEGRIFPLDAQGNILGDSVSSDRTTVIWK